MLTENSVIVDATVGHARWMSIASRWPVVVSLPVASSDCDEDGRLTEAAVERLFAQAREAYFARCTTVDAALVDVRKSTVTLGSAPVGDGVSVSAAVVEVYSDSFTMTARVRPAATDGIAATAWVSLSPGGEVPNAMRDEFIAHAHSATHMH
jgi:acyl-CoA thioesterase FadM